jgi:hypothetical protein
MERPAVVWIVAPVLVLFGLLGALVTGAAVLDAAHHGAQDAAVLVLALATLVFAAQVATAVALFAGVRWGRTGAAALCTLTIVLTWLAALAERLAPLQVFLSMAINVTLIFALLGKQVYDWTGGDRTQPIYGRYTRLDGDDAPDEGATGEA